MKLNDCFSSEASTPVKCSRLCEGSEWCSLEILWTAANTFHWSVFFTPSFPKTKNPWRPLVPWPFSLLRYNIYTQVVSLLASQVIVDFNWWTIQFTFLVVDSHTTPQLSSIGLRFFSNRIQTMLWSTESPTGLSEKVQSISTGSIGRASIS